jgi:hypothetical protein
MKTPFIKLAANNSLNTILANAADGGSPFAILQPDGFVVPYGEFPHKVGLQIFDRTAAEEIVKAHNSAMSRLARWATGNGTSYPVYVGHPDLAGSKDTDKRAYGWIENMAVTDDGLHMSVKWSEAGRDLVENAHFKFYSPLWWTKKVKGGIRPIALKSMGLTNDPNIPVPALANESETEDLETEDTREDEESQPETKEPMNPDILAALGLEEGATPEEGLAKITALTEAASAKEAAENNAQEADTAKAEAETKAAEAERVNAETLKAEKLKVEEAENALATANEKIITLESGLTAAANHAVQAALEAGRLTPAEVESKTAEILAANDFQTALADLGKLPLKVKTESATGALGAAKSRMVIAANDESAAARNERAVIVANEYAATNPAMSEGERKRIAWERARKKNPELFGVKKDSSGSAA